MTRAGFWLVVVLLATGGASPAAYAVVGGCTEVTEIDATSAQTTTELSTVRARVCGVHLVATGANAFCQVYESPEGEDPSHGQARTVAEPAAATSGNGEFVWFGDAGYITRPGFGLGARAARGRCFVQWSQTP